MSSSTKILDCILSIPTIFPLIPLSIIAICSSFNCFNSLRILDKDGNGRIEKIEPAFEWCYQNNITIVNLSFGTTNFNEYEKLRNLVNKYVNNGLIIVAATANSGFVTYPASLTNVIGIATTDSPLNYFKDYMQMGIDSVVPSEHIVKICDIETITSLSNSYAAPYICALIANKLNNDKTLDIVKLKRYAKEQSLEHLYYECPHFQDILSSYFLYPNFLILP